ncbi:hypothetical protein TNCV_4279161 [Trichonephila clavipes]|nr:hypothetical protein TNCV_4279161 [Trichonephila clavipes]
MSSIPVLLKTHLAEEANYVKSVELKRHPVDVEWKLGEGVPAQVSSSSLDHGSKRRVMPSSRKSSREVGGKRREVGDPTKLGWNRAKSYCHLHGAHN